MNFVVINWLTRFFYLLCLFFVYIIEAPLLCFYILFFFVCVEILLLKKHKSETQIFKVSQLFFISFVSYVVLVRAFIPRFSDTTNYNLNTIEHVLFAIVICVLIFYYLSFYSKNKTRNSVVFSVVIFNIIGLINEFFQNYFQGKAIFIIDKFSIKDLIANGFGTIIFIVIFKFLKTRMSVLNSIEK